MAIALTFNSTSGPRWPRFTNDDSLVVFNTLQGRNKMKLFSVDSLGGSATPTALFPGLDIPGQWRVDFKR